MNNSIKETLESRKSAHGCFWESSNTCATLKRTMQSTPNWPLMEPAKQRALEMVVEKVTRILYGDHNFADHWHDIAGYVSLIDNYITTGNERG